MSAEGVLRITPESSVEAFALQRWNRRKILVDDRDHFVAFQQQVKETLEIVAERREAFDRFLDAEAAAEKATADNSSSQ